MMRLVLLPRWVEEAIISAGKEPALVAEDVDALLTILSPADVGFYVYLNRWREQFVGAEIDRSFPMSDLACLAVADGPADATPTPREQVEQAYSMIHTTPDPISTWFGALINLDAETEKLHQRPSFSVNMLSYDTVVIRPVARKSDESVKDSMQSLYSRLLSFLYTRFSFDDVVQKPLFKEWVKGIETTV